MCNFKIAFYLVNPLYIYRQANIGNGYILFKILDIFAPDLQIF